MREVVEKLYEKEDALMEVQDCVDTHLNEVQNIIHEASEILNSYVNELGDISRTNAVTGFSVLRNTKTISSIWEVYNEAISFIDTIKDFILDGLDDEKMLLLKPAKEEFEKALFPLKKAVATDIWDEVVMYMDDDIREQVHFELAPCTKREFMDRYLELNPDFEDLKSEFGEENWELMFAE